MEFEAFPGQEGKLLYIGTGEGETAPVDTVLAILGEEGEDIEALKGGEATVPAEGNASASCSSTCCSSPGTCNFVCSSSGCCGDSSGSCPSGNRNRRQYQSIAISS
jgi:pyruvate/2-oxoglutarate dehydrogenase complex dihydrolipoamide acyltransferase (E2) component